MMFVEQCAEVFLPLLLLTTVFAMVDSNITVSDVFSTPSLSMSIQGSISGSVIQSKLHSSHINPAVTATMSSTGSHPAITTATPSNKDKKLETYIIIIIAACAAVFVFVVIILLLLCVCRRRRIQRLGRERILSCTCDSISKNRGRIQLSISYNSTVEFKIDGDRASGHVGSTSADDPFANKFTIDKYGGTTSFPAASAYLYFPKGAVSKPVTIKCIRVRHENCSAKQREGEGFCSSIMKMEPEDLLFAEPEDLVFDEPVTVLLCHSAPEEGAYRDYYDVTVQKIGEECDDLDTLRISHFEDLPQEIASDFSDIGKYLPFASATVRETCTLAVLTRIRLENIVVLPTEPYIFSKAYGNETKLTISFPAGAVKTKRRLAVQVLPADGMDSTMNDDLVCFPIIKVSGYDETFTKPVKVELDYCREEVTDIEQEFLPIDQTIRFSRTYGVLLRTRKDTQGRQKWEDVTHQVNATILRLENDQVRISCSVTHFCRTSIKLKKRKETNAENIQKIVNLCTPSSVYLILSLHDPNQSPSKLYSVVAPKHKKKEMENDWGSGAKVCQYCLQHQQSIFFCVPVLTCDHIWLDDDKILTQSDDVTYTFNNTDENTNFDGLVMRFLGSKCEDFGHSGNRFLDKVCIERRIMTGDDENVDRKAKRIQTISEPNMSLDFDEPLVNDMPYLTRADLCKGLNLESIVGQGDYKTLAGLMGMTTRDIQTISMSSDPADQLLSWWQPKISIATVAKLRELLLDPKMNREDLVKILDSSASTVSSSRKRLNPDDKSRDEEKKKVRLNEAAVEGSEPSTSSKVVESGSGNVPGYLF